MTASPGGRYAVFAQRRDLSLQYRSRRKGIFGKADPQAFYKTNAREEVDDNYLGEPHLLDRRTPIEKHERYDSTASPAT
jgi:hypothetical protein